MAANLKALSALINEAVNKIDARQSELGTPFPSLHTPIPADVPPQKPDAIVQENAAILISAATQLLATVKAPQTVIFNATCAYYLPASLRVVTETHVPEILSAAGPKGLHVNDIAKANGLPSGVLGRILRYLCIHHIFKEVKPDVFALSRISSVLNTGKSLEEILKNPLAKHDGTSGIAALVGHTSDSDCKGASYMLEQLTDASIKDRDDPNFNALTRAFGFKGTNTWAWLELPENEYRFKRFGAAMKGVSSMQPADAILKGYDWSLLAPGSVVVDVGGGIGSATRPLAENFPSLKLVIQERPSVVKEGTELWKAQYPEALTSGRVTFQDHDFFDTQPVQKARVFLLKQICHDWGNSYAARILKELRKVAEPVVLSSDGKVVSGTELLLIDCIIPYACDMTEADSSLDVPGLQTSTAPAPLLPHLADIDAAPYFTDLSMFVEFNAQERTIGELQALLKEAGWRIVRVYPADGASGYYPQLLAHPM